jgi:vacuolar-type H+-ATPase subunit H
MERDLLNKVLEAEKEIQAKIESEKKRCAETLLKARKEAEEKVAREESILREQRESFFKKSEEIAEKKAAGILEAAVRKAANIRSLADETLQKIVMKYIDSNLSGGAD